MELWVGGCGHVSEGLNKLLFCLSNLTLYTQTCILVHAYKHMPKFDKLAAFYPVSLPEAVYAGLLI